MSEKILNKTNNFLLELIRNQRKDINIDKKLNYNDLKKINRYLTKSIFDNECSIWNGHITLIKNNEKNSYINFFFNKKNVHYKDYYTLIILVNY
jgi:DNA topoisomerase VI subunit A